MKFDTKTKPVNLTQLEMQKEQMSKLLEHDAVYCNKFYFAAQGDGMVRLVLADSDNTGEVIKPRFSVIMPLQVYSVFAQLIKSNEENVNKLMEHMQKKQADSSGKFDTQEFKQ